ncbi:hypothetical protein IMZ48_35805 [Candidatus Bathyarchaeota archaeon]|nr:hypothetical protein [Candidatus Bathyarchaeota archaeon]
MDVVPADMIIAWMEQSGHISTDLPMRNGEETDNAPFLFTTLIFINGVKAIIGRHMSNFLAVTGKKGTKDKTYSTGDSLVVTDPTTSPALHSFIS